MDYEKAFGKLPEDKPMWVIPVIMVEYEKKIVELRKRIAELEKETEHWHGHYQAKCELADAFMMQLNEQENKNDLLIKIIEGLLEVEQKQHPESED